MATPRFARSPTCLSCLRRLAAQPSPASAFSSPVPPTWARIQTRAASRKADAEDLSGIPVRLLRDVPTFGRKNAIIRVRPGRMRNLWFPQGVAEYMTKKRFEELGLSESAIVVRDRGFGSKTVLVVDKGKAQLEAWKEEREREKNERKKKLTLEADEAFSILSAIIPETLIFPRRAQPTPAPEPAVPRSPSLAVHANTSMGGPAKPKAASAVQAIFGSVTRDDIVAQIKQELLTAPEGSRVALEADSVEIQGLDPEHDGPDRIKRLGSFEVLIYADATVEGKKGEPVKRVVKVVSQQDMPKEVSQTEAAESSS